MSRKERVLKKRYAIFCEGDTEYSYIDIVIKKTDYNQEALDKKNSNIEEFFDVIEW